MLWSGFMRPNMWLGLLRAYRRQISGNLEGEGRLLGGVFVVGPGDQGIVYEHRNADFSDQANWDEVVDAVQLIQPTIPYGPM
ncbi:peroxiredoxin-like 2A [Saccoglossus kowalevskii]